MPIQPRLGEEPRKCKQCGYLEADLIAEGYSLGKVSGLCPDCFERKQYDDIMRDVRFRNL